MVCHRWFVFVALCGCGGDLLNNAGIHAYVDETPTAQPISRAATSFELLVPIWGSYMLDRHVYGSVRPSGVVFDWILGGLVPAVLTGSSFAVHDADTRSLLRWSALGLYAGTRVGVEVIGNLHVSEYNGYLSRRGEVRTGLRTAYESRGETSVPSPSHTASSCTYALREGCFAARGLQSGAGMQEPRAARPLANTEQSHAPRCAQCGEHLDAERTERLLKRAGRMMCRDCEFEAMPCTD